MRKLKRLIRMWRECRTHRCTYYEHYLAYGPADLTHEGYHAAERKCDYWQRELSKWWDENGDKDVAEPRALVKVCHEWERRVRA